MQQLPVHDSTAPAQLTVSDEPLTPAAPFLSAETLTDAVLQLDDSAEFDSAALTADDSQNDYTVQSTRDSPAQDETSASSESSAPEQTAVDDSAACNTQLGSGTAAPSAPQSGESAAVTQQLPGPVLSAALAQYNSQAGPALELYDDTASDGTALAIRSAAADGQPAGQAAAETDQSQYVAAAPCEVQYTCAVELSAIAPQSEIMCHSHNQAVAAMLVYCAFIGVQDCAKMGSTTTCMSDSGFRFQSRIAQCNVAFLADTLFFMCLQTTSAAAAIVMEDASDAAAPELLPAVPAASLQLPVDSGAVGAAVGPAVLTAPPPAEDTEVDVEKALEDQVEPVRL